MAAANAPSFIDFDFKIASLFSLMCSAQIIQD
jgi:hypothetical protein